MRIFITGATGLIGRRLVVDRLERGDRVTVLSRDADKAGRIFAADVNPNIEVVGGDPRMPGDWQGSVDGCDAVVHLAGAGIAVHRWSASYKRELVNSRVDSTGQVVQAIEAASRRPSVLVNASATGYYGETGAEPTDESAYPPPKGVDFLADLCVCWEAQARRAIGSGTRVVLLRTGMVLDDRGGALAALMKPFRLFLGGWLGTGRQFVSWVHSRDMIGLIDLALRNERIDQALNCVSPNPVTNKVLMSALGKAVDRPSWLPVPKLAVRMAVGAFADFLFMSQRIVPTAALDAGYHFFFPFVDEAVGSLIGELDRQKGINEMRLDHGFESNHADGASAAVSFDSAMMNDLVGSRPEALAQHRVKRERPAAPIRLLAVDVDGTLLRSDGRLGQSVIDACRRATRKACVIVPATARPPRAMRSLLQTLDLSGPMINYNGALIWDSPARTWLHHEALDPDLVRSIIAEARHILPDVVVSVEILDKWYTDRVDPGLPTETSRVFEPDFIGSLDSFLDQPITKLMLLAERAAIGPVQEMVRESYWSKKKIAVFITDPHIIQIAHPLVDKGIALQRVARRLGVERDEVMVIGDGPNDAGMIEWGGFSVAVENACDTVRKLADQIVPSNDNHGVARAIQRYILSDG